MEVRLPLSTYKILSENDTHAPQGSAELVVGATSEIKPFKKGDRIIAYWESPAKLNNSYDSGVVTLLDKNFVHYHVDGDTENGFAVDKKNVQHNIYSLDIGYCMSEDKYEELLQKARISDSISVWQ